MLNCVSLQSHAGLFQKMYCFCFMSSYDFFSKKNQLGKKDRFQKKIILVRGKNENSILRLAKNLSPTQSIFIFISVSLLINLFSIYRNVFK